MSGVEAMNKMDYDTRFDNTDECPETQRDPNAGSYDDDEPYSDRISHADDMRMALAEAEAADYADHCCDDDDAWPEDTGLEDIYDEET